MLMLLLRPVYVTLFILFFGVVLTTWNVYQLSTMQNKFFEEGTKSDLGTCEKESENFHTNSYPNLSFVSKQKPIAWIIGQNLNTGYLNHVIDAFQRFGYSSYFNFDDLPAQNFIWDVMWSHEYPFFNKDLRPYIDSIKSHQKINHVPGSGFYTSKVSLATSGIKMGVPLAFEMPKEKEKFLKFEQKHPDFLWVQKSNAHRGIEILRVDQMELDKPDTFVQKYVENPFLIDGKKFDIGVYTVITSVDPLRVYIYSSDALFRFCPEQSFFELARFDFVVDKNLKVFLMEANMSPNLSSSHFLQNKLLYEQVLMNVLSLVGATHFYEIEREETLRVDVSDKDVNIFSQECFEKKCNNCNEEFSCKLCSHCLEEDFREDLRQAYLENLLKRNMKRILPFSGSNSRKVDDNLSEKSKLQEFWFHKKCENEQILCH